MANNNAALDRILGIDKSPTAQKGLQKTSQLDQILGIAPTQGTTLTATPEPAPALEILKPATPSGQVTGFDPLSAAFADETAERPQILEILAEKARGAGEFIGLDKAIDPLARTAARATVPEELKGAIPEASAAEIAGGAAQVGSLLLPFGAIASTTAKVAAKVIPATAAKIFGKATAAAIGGFAFEGGEKLQRGERPIPGMMTLTSAAIPGGIGVISATGKLIAEKIPARIINSLIKPLLKDFSYGKNPGRAVAEEKIVANSFDGLVSKISEKRGEIGGILGDVAVATDKAAASKGITLNLTKALRPIDKAMEKAAQQNNQTLLSELNSVRYAITEKLGQGVSKTGQPTIVSIGKKNLTASSFAEAIEIKKAIGDLTKFTGNVSDDAIRNKALKQVYGGVKEVINNKARQADAGLSIKFAKLNEKYADITTAEIAGKYRDKILQRQNIISLKAHFGAVGGAIITLIATGGSGGAAAIAGLSGIALDKALASTAVKTRIASWLSKATQAEKLAVFEASPSLAAAITKKFKKEVRFPGDIALRGAKKSIASIKAIFQKKVKSINSQDDFQRVFTPEYVDEIRRLPPGQGFELVEKFEALKRAGRILPEIEGEIQKLLSPGQGFKLPTKVIRRPVVGATATPAGKVTLRN